LLAVVRARAHGTLPGNEDQNDNDLAGLIGVSVHHPADEAGTAMPSWTLRASVGHTSARIAIPPNCVGHIDRGGFILKRPVLDLCPHRLFRRW
jgi:hypothetical protein